MNQINTNQQQPVLRQKDAISKRIDPTHRLASVWQKLIIEYPDQDGLIAEYINSVTGGNITSFVDFCTLYDINEFELVMYYESNDSDILPESLIRESIHQYCEYQLNTQQRNELELEFRNKGPTDSEYLIHLHNYEKRKIFFKQNAYVITINKKN